MVAMLDVVSCELRGTNDVEGQTSARCWHFSRVSDRSQ